MNPKEQMPVFYKLTVNPYNIKTIEDVQVLFDLCRLSFNVKEEEMSQEIIRKALAKELVDKKLLEINVNSNN